jgi:Sec-independent protein translocase protein TatA
MSTTATEPVCFTFGEASPSATIATTKVPSFDTTRPKASNGSKVVGPSGAENVAAKAAEWTKNAKSATADVTDSVDETAGDQNPRNRRTTAQLRKKDAAGSHILTKTVEQSLEHFVGERGFKPYDALQLIGRKLDAATEQLKVSASEIREKREKAQEKYGVDVTKVEQRREALLTDFTDKVAGHFLNWLKQRNVALYRTVTQTVKESLDFRQNRKNEDPQSALISVKRTMSQCEAAVTEYRQRLQDLEDRWNRLHAEYSWIGATLEGVTRQAWELSFGEFLERWSDDNALQTLDFVEGEATTPFVSNGSGSRSRRSASRPKPHSTQGPAKGPSPKDNQTLGETGGNTPNARRRRRTAGGRNVTAS